ncbi:DUF4037 domain-containing protein [Jiangella muralis]|uniref:DUF4037 domain-containing protein n=1 Tax=Jiangella muralis TaxID=702383 RepID=UPI00069CFF1E|nr:DUF4037 domain-containing protein [Jiangella muralis]
MGTDRGPDGRELARAYYEQLVWPLLASRWPAFPHAAGRLGQGSDVLGLDDETSRDHDWGLRLSLFVDAAMTDEVRSFLDGALPDTFLGLPTRFAFTGQSREVHHIEVDSVSGFTTARLGFDPGQGMNDTDWLSLTGQAVLEVTGGPVFADTTGEIGAVHRLLEWYPDDLWRYVVACDWLRVEQELPLMSRAGERGDDLGSRVIAARLVDVLVHLAFLLERRWAPYSKWRGTLFGELKSAAGVQPRLTAVLEASDWRARQGALREVLDRLLEAQRAAGLPAPGPATVPFWDRPYLMPNENVAASLLDGVASPAVRALPRGRGSVEQRTDNVAILADPVARRCLATC